MSDDASDIPSARKAPKTSAACDRCRDKKRKCDGKKPFCTYCVSVGYDCQYRGRQKTRGPVAGYLRNLERRVVWLESAIVYVGRNVWDDGSTPGSTSYKALIQGFISATKSQDDWKSLQETFKQDYESITTAAQTNIENGPKIAGVKRTREESAAGDVAATSSISQDRPVETNGSRPPESVLGWNNRDPTDLFASTTTALPSASDTMPTPTDSHHQSGDHHNGYNFDMMDMAVQPHASGSGNTSRMDVDPRFSSIFGVGHTPTRGMFGMGFGDVTSQSNGNVQPRLPVPLHNDHRQPSPFATGTDFLSTSITRQAFDLDYDSNLRQVLDSQDVIWSNNAVEPAQGIQLPPKPIQNSLIQVHLAHIHPILPFLDHNQLTTYISSESTDSLPGHPPPSRILILAICAYSACTSPTLGGLAPDIDSLNEDVSAGGSLAEVWAEEVRSTLLSSTLKRRCSIDAVQAIVLLVLRDQGKAQNFQTWLWLGIAVRLAQDLGLHHADRQLELEADARRHRVNIWTTLCFLDVMLSLQLGRPSAVELDIEKVDVGHKADGGDTRAFGHLQSLCYILQAIRRNLNCTPQASASQLDIMRTRLRSWKAALPPNLQAGLGDEVSLDVALLLMVYHMAVLLAWKPTNQSEGLPRLKTITLATSPFMTLLDGTQFEGDLQPSLLMRCPQAIYSVFTVAISLISTIRQYRSAAVGTSTKPSPNILKARVSLLTCTEAIGDVAKLWPLARRCHDILQRLSEEENLESLNHAPGPRTASIPAAMAGPSSAVGLIVPGPPNAGDFLQHFVPSAAAGSSYQNFVSTPFQTGGAGDWGFDEDLYAMLNLDQE